MFDSARPAMRFRFPLLAAWKPVSQCFQRLAGGFGAVSGRISCHARKPKFFPYKLLINKGFRFPDFPPPTGDRIPETGPAPLGRGRKPTTGGADDD